MPVGKGKVFPGFIFIFIEQTLKGGFGAKRRLMNNSYIESSK